MGNVSKYPDTCTTCKHFADLKLRSRWVHRCKVTEVQVTHKTKACPDYIRKPE